MPPDPPEAISDELTAPQRAAVTHTNGPLLVLAGAGSGKTRVITQRAVRLARTAARPDQILAITFTNKAAGEVRDRIHASGVAGGMWVCTFHSLCARLLRQYGRLVGVGSNYSIFDESDRLVVLRQAVANCDLNADNWRPAAVLAAISGAKNKMLTPQAFAEDAGDFVAKTMARIYTEYQQLLSDQNACDFDDLLMRVAGLLGEHEAVRTELSNRFRYLLIDEYQDTNRAQYVIAARLAEAHRNICATGDPDQSIYAWRGADIRNILDFEADYPDATVIRLEQNFRSTGAVLSAASFLISKNVHRKHKKLWTQGEWGPAVRVWSCQDQNQEAERIATDIRRHCDAGGQAGDVAIFYRVNALSRALEDALRRCDIPYQIARGVAFYGRKEIKDVLAYLRAIANPADEVAALRAINTPARGIGKTTIGRLQAYARQHRVTIEQAIINAPENPALKSAIKRISPFAGLLAELRSLPSRPVQDIVTAVLDQSGIESALRDKVPDVAGNEPLANIYELATAAQQYDREFPDGSLTDWLQGISLVTDVDSVELAGGPTTLMTLHAAKGLEFPWVYIVGLEDGLLPHHRAIHGADTEALEEERRLCFVGMTRAKQQLTLTHAKYRTVRAIEERAVASTFLRELPDDEIDHQRFEADQDRSSAHLRDENETMAAIEAADYFPDQRVRHPEYGDGNVVGLQRIGRTVYIRVRFDEHGARSFALAHAPLVVIECP